jgi:leucyl aminopeptidase
MEFSTKPTSPEAIKTDCLVIGVHEDAGMTQAASLVDKVSGGAIKSLIASGDMPGKRGSLVVLRQLPGIASARVAVVGLGNTSDFTSKAFADACILAVRSAGAGIRHLAFAVSDWSVAEKPLPQLLQDAVIALRATRFRTDELKSQRKDDDKAPRVTWLTGKRDAAVDRALRQGTAVANGQDLAKRLANLPGNVCTPSYLANEARKMARQFDLSAQILDRRQIEALGMGSFLSVTHGSDQPPRLIVLRYLGAGSKSFSNPIALVGKGITFDSGGISLKPGAQMDEMKYDMGGAAAVLGTMRTLAELKPRINVVAVIPACENLPSGSATKPGDIVTSMSGQTIEVLNTDAEGRLILCDALTYVQRFKPSAIVDVATLTGACVVALGNVHSGLFSSDDGLATDLLAAGRQTGDTAWRLPLDDDYQDQLKSNFADIANIGLPGNAGSITAACFLSRFTKGQSWAHLDIAGTAWRGGAAKGATGRPVALLTQFVMTRAA